MTFKLFLLVPLLYISAPLLRIYFNWTSVSH